MGSIYYPNYRLYIHICIYLFTCIFVNFTLYPKLRVPQTFGRQYHYSIVPGDDTGGVPLVTRRML